jgi:UDP-glucose 4-epimerase
MKNFTSPVTPVIMRFIPIKTVHFIIIMKYSNRIKDLPNYFICNKLGFRSVVNVFMNTIKMIYSSTGPDYPLFHRLMISETSSCVKTSPFVISSSAKFIS